MASDQWFQAAASYWLIRPPMMGRRRILPRDWLRDGCVRAWRAQVQRSMRPVPVVVQRVLGEDAAQVSLAEDQHSIGDLGSDGSARSVRRSSSRADTAAGS
jgi:hypothetical protein